MTQSPVSVAVVVTVVAAVIVAMLATPAIATPASTSIDGPSEIQPGETATYDITMTNTGENATGYVLNLSISEELAVVNHSDDGGSWRGSSTDWVWLSVDPGETKAPSLTLSIPANASGPVHINASVFDPNGLQDDATQTVTIADDVGELSVTNFTAPADAEQGEEITVSADITHSGDIELAQDVVFNVDGTQEASQEVTLNSGQQSVSFTYTVPADELADTLSAEITTVNDSDTAVVSVLDEADDGTDPSGGDDSSDRNNNPGSGDDDSLGNADNSDENTGAGGGDDDDGRASTGAPSIEQVAESLSAIEPKSNTTLGDDTAGAESGVKTDAESTESNAASGETPVEANSSVQAVTFENTDSQPVTVTDYGEPSETVERGVIDSIAADNEEIMPATGAGTNDSRTASSDDSGGDGDDSTAASGDAGDTEPGEANVVQLAKIEPNEEITDGAQAEVDFTIDRDKVMDPNSVTVYKDAYVPEAQAEQWVEAETTVTEVTDETVSVSARINEFSLFAVMEVTAQKSTTNDTATAAQTETPSISAGTDTEGNTASKTDAETATTTAGTTFGARSIGGSGFVLVAGISGTILSLVLARRRLS